MPISTPSLHVYDQQIDLDAEHSLSKIIQLIPEGSSVLDLGPGTGALGRYLGSQKQCVVDGIEINPVQIEQAKPYYRQLWQADLNTVDVPVVLGPARYDVIVCADVIEHLADPARLLNQLPPLLAVNGRLLISVPNVGYAGLLAHVMLGDFRYGPEGLLDTTHLRFFTRRSVLRLLEACGFGVPCIATVERPWVESEFQRDELSLLPDALRQHLGQLPDANVYQFLLTAQPGISSAPTVFHAGRYDWACRVQLFWRYGDEPFNASSSAVQKAPMGSERTFLRFDFPADERVLTGLRWDPLDRPGYVRLFAMRLRNARGDVVWSWSGQRDLLTGQRPEQIIFAHPSSTDGLTFMSMGDDPQLVLDIPLLALAHASTGGCFEVEQSAPLSGDYMALHERFLKPESQLARTLATDDQVWQIDLLTQKNQNLRQVADAQVLALSEAEIVRQQLAFQIQAQAEKMEQLNQRLGEREIELAHTKSNLDRASRAENELREVYTSRVWRVASVLRRISLMLNPPQPLSAVVALPPVPSPVPQPIEVEEQAPEVPVRKPFVPNYLTRIHAGVQPNLSAPVDVIVPVYGGFEPLRACLESVWAHEQATAFELIVIDDASPDPELAAWLRAVAQEGRITLLRNEINLGFVATVNRGMALHPERDVLLLNSDTVVAGAWLDRLISCAYAEPDIATVTPLSNNATICSYPRFCENNPLPVGTDLAQLNQLCVHANANTLVDLPTGVGFCFYIRRPALVALGMFDVQNFGKGYGEENDFCQRALKNGWRNVLAADVFVFHHGGVSFGESQASGQQRAIEVMGELHPNYATDVAEFVAADPVKPIRTALDLRRLSSSTLPLLLLVSHNRNGGTQKHIENVAALTAGQCTCLLLQPIAKDDRVVLTWMQPGEVMALEFAVDTDYALLLSVLRQLKLSRVHLHHTLGIPEPLWTLPQDLGVPYDYTAHDYYSACPQISLTKPDHSYCQELGPAECAACLRQRPAPGGVSIEAWREKHATVLNHAERVITPSTSTSQRIARYFPLAPVITLPHPEPLVEYPEPRAYPMLHPRPLKIVVIGGLSEIKGADVLDDCARDARTRHLPLAFHLIGYAYWHITGQANEAFPLSGKYDDADLPALLAEHKPDLVWFPALWPETYSYTLSAVLAAGLPVVVSNIGAQAERVADRPWSWTMDWRMTSLDFNHFFMHLRETVFMGNPTWDDVRHAAWKRPLGDYMVNYLEPLNPRSAEAGICIELPAPLVQKWAFKAINLQAKIDELSL